MRIVPLPTRIGAFAVAHAVFEVVVFTWGLQQVH